MKEVIEYAEEVRQKIANRVVVKKTDLEVNREKFSKKYVSKLEGELEASLSILPMVETIIHKLEKVNDRS